MIEIKLIKNTLLFLSVLGIAQTGSSAVHRTYSATNTITSNSATSNYNSTRSITAASNTNYGSSQDSYSTNNAGGAHISSNDEISQAISGLNNRAHQKNYELATLTNRLYQNQTKSSDSLKEIKKWADQGNVEYQVKLGLIYYEGKNIRQDLVSSRKMFQKAASQGSIQAQGMLGYFYESGLGGLRQNKATAKEWYGKVCDKGYKDGCTEYRRLNQYGY